MSDIGHIGADFESHHIQGYARAAQERGLVGYFNVPLISPVEGNLWQGGCIDGVSLPADFKHVVSLYPWEQYALPDGCERVEVRMYDSLDQDTAAVDSVAAMVVGFCQQGKTLVHCQAGLNRSGLVAARALMMMGRTAREAIDLLRASRCDMVLCNQAFERWLLSLDGELAA
jgi:protein-tyrosine phosphatase